ncbi:MAG: hypothetical protein FJX20_00480 [Alphaproteobacteria bacterium]|nr:hypothetical protein [Alphaproteobacteria bacterium]
MTNDERKRLVKELVACAKAYGVTRIDVVPPDEETPMLFSARPKRLLSPDEGAALCREWVPRIRRVVPDRKDTWAAGIMIWSPYGPPLGTYVFGFASEADTWLGEPEPLTSAGEWEALHTRLEAFLAPLGVNDSEDGADFFLFDEDNGDAWQSITIFKIEHLTPSLIAGIQAALRDGYANWTVGIVLLLEPPFDDLPDKGLEIRVDSVVEKWDRALLTKRLGDRLKV